VSIRNKLLLTFLGLAFLPLFVVGGGGFYAGKDAIQKSTTASLVAVAELKAKRAAAFVADKGRALRTLRHSSVLLRNLPVLTRHADVPGHSEFAAATRALDEALSPLQALLGLEDIHLLAPDSRILYQSNKKHAVERTGRPFPEVGAQGPETQQAAALYRCHEEGPYALLLSEPIRGKDGAILGFVAFEVGVEGILDQVRDQVGLGRTGITVLGKTVSGQGYIHLTPPHKGVGHDPNLVSPFSEAGTMPMEEALAGHSGTGLVETCEGAEVIAAWRPLPELGLGMVVKVNTDEAFASVSRLERLVLILSLFVSLIGMGVALGVARSISSPLYRLQKGTEEIGRGNLDCRVGTLRQDEVGVLSRAFDRMAQNLKQVTASREELNREVAERQEALALLLQSEARYRDLFDNASDLIQSVAPDGSFLLVNRAWCETLGYDQDEVGSLSLFEIIHPDCLEHCMGVFQRIMAGETVDSIETSFKARDGRKVTVEGNVNIHVEDGRPVATRAIFRDITERKKAEDKLREVGLMKSEFISTAAHELRTPLASLMGYTELLLNPEEFGNFEPEQQREFLGEIYDKGEVLSKITDDILDISRIESGQAIPLEMGFWDLPGILKKVVGQFQSRAVNHRFELALAADFPENICLDRNKMVQVLENLLSNAVKYSPGGGEIRVEGCQVDDRYQLSVTDEGIGMTPEQVERIFDKFYRADASNTAVGGLGLGMGIAKNIVEMHGGTIWVESEPSRGTRVCFILPIGLQAQAAGEAV